MLTCGMRDLLNRARLSIEKFLLLIFGILLKMVSPLFPDCTQNLLHCYDILESAVTGYFDKNAE